MHPGLDSTHAHHPLFTRERLDVRRVLDRLVREDAVCLPILAQKFRLALLHEATERDYRPARHITATRYVFGLRHECRE